MKPGDGGFSRVRGRPPSALTSQTEVAPPTEVSYARVRPSGDQAGLPANVRCDVTGRGFDPSRSQTQTSYTPVRFEVNAIFRPSGEMRGSSSERVEAISLRKTVSPFVSAQIFR